MLYCYADFFVTSCLAQITLLCYGQGSERRMQDEGSVFCKAYVRKVQGYQEKRAYHGYL